MRLQSSEWSNKTVDGREVLHGYLMDVIRSSGAPSNADIEAARAGVAWLRERRCHSVKSGAFVRGTQYEALLSKVGFWTKRSSGASTKHFYASGTRSPKTPSY